MSKTWKARYVLIFIAIWLATYLIGSILYAIVAFCFGRWHGEWREAIFHTILLCTPLLLLYTYTSWLYVRNTRRDTSIDEQQK